MLDSGCLCYLSESRSLGDGRCFVEVVQEVRKCVAVSQKVSGKLDRPSMAGASRNDGRLSASKSMNLCRRCLFFSVCRSEQHVNLSMSFWNAFRAMSRAERLLRTIVCLHSLRNVCLSACDSQRRAHQHHAISSERRWISARVQCCGCNLPLRSCVMRSFCVLADLIHRVVLPFLRGWS